MDGYVRQLDGIGGVVIECSCVAACMKSNPDLSAAQQSTYPGCGKVKKCQLVGNPDHGNRCAAYPQDTTTWFIDSDSSKIKQIPR
jgi:hypothetical protein